MLKLLIPREILDWIESERGTLCRASFILKILKHTMQNTDLDNINMN